MDIIVYYDMINKSRQTFDEYFFFVYFDEYFIMLSTLPKLNGTYTTKIY